MKILIHTLIYFLPIILNGQLNNVYIEYNFTDPNYQANYDKIKKGYLYVDDTSSIFIYDKISDQKTKNYSFSEKGLYIDGTPTDEMGCMIFRNYKSKLLICRIAKQKWFEPYNVVDNWVNIEWILLNDYKKIRGFICQKATCYFRGRNYTVWYTNQIPISAGPWKLFGLPGLILNAKDEEGMVKFEVTNIQYPSKEIKPTFIIEKTKKNIKEETEFLDNKGTLIDKKIREHIFSKMPRGVTVVYNGNNNINRKYNLEKKFEWEE